MRNMLRVAVSTAFLAFCITAIAQDANEPPPSLRNLLITKYKLTKTAFGPNGTQVIDAGPVFDLKKGGLFGVNPTSFGKCQAQFKGGDIKPPGRFCTAGDPNGRFLDVGERVFLTKLDVNTKRSTITIDVMECDACNGVQQVSSLKSSVVFSFAPGFLDNAAPGQVSDVIDQVLGPDEGAAQQPAAAEQPAQPVAAAPPPQPQQAPSQIKKGDSPAQVEAAMGQPDTKINVGPKLVYVYKSLNLKVIFMNGQVSDIQ
ncbi:hypothetical protein ACFPT7_04605 [Acidicapsa dinghuensis]|uniref:Uncharacterized protein n=1 Tax=Acidicapsa dinghuensis TaxID=2218256 RepID=A0ABW1EB97_9BACT|nr:hypothetical protein [Acidicapsa dinghuensis]